MGLRIAFDLDGVLADMDGELARHAGRLFGSAPVPPPTQPLEAAGAPADAAPVQDESTPPVRLNITARQQQRLWEHVAAIENFWETLAEIEPGSVARLADLAARHRWEIIFLTKRPRTDGRTAQVQSQRWLEAKGFPLPSVFIVRGSRGRIADALALDIVVDDRPENCLDVVMDSKARSILVWRGDDAQLPAGAKRLVGLVQTVAECLDVLAEAAAPEQPGLVSRVMRALGLRSGARS